MECWLRSRESRRKRQANVVPRMFWLCQCDCGNTKEIRGDVLRRGRSHSCGCKKLKWMSDRKSNARVGKTSAVLTFGEKFSNAAVTQRIHPYDNYGGRGITVCQEWRGDMLRVPGVGGVARLATTIDDRANQQQRKLRTGQLLLHPEKVSSRKTDGHVRWLEKRVKTQGIFRGSHHRPCSPPTKSNSPSPCSPSRS